MNNTCPLLYLFIYKNLKDRSRNTQAELTTQVVLEVVRRNLHNLPTSMIYTILEEMESKHNLIRRINHMKYQVIPSNKDKILNRYLDLL